MREEEDEREGEGLDRESLAAFVAEGRRREAALREAIEEEEEEDAEVRERRSAIRSC